MARQANRGETGKSFTNNKKEEDVQTMTATHIINFATVIHSNKEVVASLSVYVSESRGTA